MNLKYRWNKNSLAQADIVSSVLHLIERDKVWESRNSAGLLDVVSKMVMAAREVGANMITDLVNQILVGVTPTRWELSTIVNCY